MIHPLRRIMVSIAMAFIVLVPSLLKAITPDEIRAIDDEAARKQKAKDARVKPGEVDQLLPAAKATDESPTSSSPRSMKYAAASSSMSASSADVSTPAREPMVRVIGAPRTATETPFAMESSPSPAVRTVAPSDAIRSDGVMASTKNYFGISLGTWFEVSLTRNVSNAESGQVELTVIEDVPGSRRTMPSGTLLFAEKNYNQGTKRLDCRAVRGITPKGYEFKISAWCFDLQKVAGLNGIVNVDEKAVANKGLQRGVLSALRTAATSVTGGNTIAAQGVQGAADSVLNDTRQAADQAAGPIYTIFVAPQTMLIRVDESL